MQLQIILINIMFIVNVCVYVQTIPVLQENSSPMEYSNNTNELSLPSYVLICITDKDCHIHNWCNKGKCECRKGWITWSTGGPCSYQQISKSSTFIISLFVGGAGIDWFILSRKDIIYILIGILKFLISIAGVIWGRLATMSKTETSVTIADCLSACLGLISVIWWLIDWIRILVNRFPDGYGAPLI